MFSVQHIRNDGIVTVLNNADSTIAIDGKIKFIVTPPKNG
jgi:hypothetical protein